MSKLLSLIAVGLPQLVCATTYHVSVAGSNGNTGTSLATAWATLQHAADVAVAGDSVVVHSGSYQGFAAMDQSGTAMAPIVFTAMGNTVLITSPCSYNGLDGINVENVEWVVVEGFTVNGMPRVGIRTALSDHVTLRYNTCADNGVWGILTGFAEHCIIEHNTCSGSVDQHGIYFSNSADDPIIRYNHCFDNHDNGIHMNGDVSLGGDGVISNAQVYGNTIHDNGTGGGSGINCDGVVNSVFYNNLLYGNHASGISLYQIDAGAPSTGNRVFNNTILNASDARWCINITEGCTDNQVLNNILITAHPFRGSIVVAADALDGFVSDHNLVTPRLSPDGDATILDLSEWQALGYDLHSQVAAPLAQLFATQGAPGMYYPLDASAQMVDAGTAAVAAVVTDDLQGTPRPQLSAYDIGCWEFLPAMGEPQRTEAAITVRNGVLLLPVGHGAEQLTVIDPAGRIVYTASVANAVMHELPVRGINLLLVQDRAGRSLWKTRVVLP